MLNRPPQGARCDINYAVIQTELLWLELHIHELYLTCVMELYDGAHFMRPQSWFYLMVTRFLFDGTHFNSISCFMTELFREYQEIVTTEHTSCLEKSRSLSVFVILSEILRLDHCDRG